MKVLNPKIDLNDFWGSLKNSDKSILFLDYDGTLAPFVDDRDKAYPYPEVPALLEQLMTTTRIIVVSGRPVKTIQKFLQLKKEYEIWGNHGYEHYIPGQAEVLATLEPEMQNIIATALDFARANVPGKNIEVKPFSLAVHWRGEEDQNRWKSKIHELWLTLCEQGGTFEIHEFDGGYELRPLGKNKGYAVETVLKTCNDEYVCAYLGDDLTDEDAFEAMGTQGLKVLVKQQHRETLADIQVNPPEELLEFLQNWSDHTN